MADETSSAERLNALLRERAVKAKLQELSQSIQQKFTKPSSEKYEAVFKPGVDKHVRAELFHDLIISRLNQPAATTAEDLCRSI